MVTLANAADDAGALALCHVGRIGAKHESLTGDVVAVEVVGLAALEVVLLALSEVGVRDEVVECGCERCGIKLCSACEHVGTFVGIVGRQCSGAVSGYQLVVFEQDGCTGLAIGACRAGVVLGVDGHGHTGVDDIDDIDRVGSQAIDNDKSALAVLIGDGVTLPLLTNGRVGVVG